MSMNKQKNYSACRLTVIKEVAAGAQLLTVPRCVAVRNADQINVTHSFRSTQIQEVKTPSLLVVDLLLIQRLVVFGVGSVACVVVLI